MIRFPSIEQYYKAIKTIQKACQKQEVPVPQSMIFQGTVKLHGTNAGVGYDVETGSIWAQSRSKVIVPGEKDNCGFAAFVEENKKVFEEMFVSLPEDGRCCIFGEWCGEKIQKGVAINSLPRMFVIFAVGAITNGPDGPEYRWLSANKCNHLESPENRIFNIHSFPKWEVEIDCTRPELAVPELERITHEVETLCPVGAALGVKGVGEGVVWEARDSDIGVVRFKTKGEKHRATNRKSSAPVDVEQLASIDAFLEYAVTENRLQQGLEQVFQSNGEEPHPKGMGAFISWVVKDVFKEESDTLESNKLADSRKEVSKQIATKARGWLLTKV